jgi:hypothetical protein
LSESSRILPSSGMTRNGIVSVLRTSAPHTKGVAFGLLPTCRASDADRGGRGDLLQALRGNHNKHFRFPTPTASLYGNNRGGAAGRTGKIRHSLEHFTGGPWPSFREWMMGWPIGWTVLEPLEMDRFQQWLQWHGQC